MSTVTSITDHLRPRFEAPTFAQWVDDKRKSEQARARCYDNGSDADYPMAPLVQLDAWANIDEGDSVMEPDHERDVMFGGGSYEPQRCGTTVRVHIAGDADPSDAIRLLRKAADWLEREPDLIHRMNPARPYDPRIDQPPF